MMIRPATADDAAAIAAFWAPLVRETAITFNSLPKTADEVAAMIATRAADGFATLVADDGAGPAGFASYAQFRGGVGYARCMEHTVILSPAAQGRGAGRALMAGIEAHARTRGAHQMIAGVSGENPEGRAFHARIGYAEVAVIPAAGFKFGRYMDLVLMQKFL